MKIGYIRVSTAGQKVDRQLDGIELEKTFQDVASAKDTKRPGLRECLSFVREGDELHVHSIDRLARNLGNLNDIVADLTGRGVAVIFHKEQLRFTGQDSHVDKLLLGLLGAIYEFERAIISERRREGLEKAKKAGKKLGPKYSLDEKQTAELVSDWKAGMTAIHLSRKYSMNRATVYRTLKRMGVERKFICSADSI